MSNVEGSGGNIFSGSERQSPLRARFKRVNQGLRLGLDTDTPRDLPPATHIPGTRPLFYGQLIPASWARPSGKNPNVILEFRNNRKITINGTHEILPHADCYILNWVAAKSEVSKRSLKRKGYNLENFDFFQGNSGENIVEITEHGVKLAEGVAIKEGRDEFKEVNDRNALYGERYYSPHLPGMFITKAVPGDYSTSIDLRERVAAMKWADTKTGDQWQEPWPSEEMQAQRIIADMASGNTYFLWGEDEKYTIHLKGQRVTTLKGQMTLKTNGDERLWTPDELAQPAIYLSRLISTEKHKEIGVGMLETAADVVATSGYDYVRIDVWNTNPQLVDYYLEHGFEVVRKDKINGYPSCVLMQRRITGHNEKEIDNEERQDIQLPSLSGRGNWNSIYTSGGLNQEEMERVYIAWERYGSFLYCPDVFNPWLFTPDGVQARLDFESMSSEKNYEEFVCKIGLAKSFIHFNDPNTGGIINNPVNFYNYISYNRPIADINEHNRWQTIVAEGRSEFSLTAHIEDAIKNSQMYESAVERLVDTNGTAIEPLLEGVINQSGQLAFEDSEIYQVDMSQWDVSCFKFPEPDENGKLHLKRRGLLPTQVIPGDKVQIRLRRNTDTGTFEASMLIMEKGQQRIDDEFRYEAEAREVIDKTHLLLRDDPEVDVSQIVQDFYGKIIDHSYEDVNDEKRFRKDVLIKNGIFAVEPFLFDYIDSNFIGKRVSTVCSDIIQTIQQGGIDELRRSTVYLSTFESFPIEYSLLSEEIMLKADELDCIEDAYRMFYAKWSRNVELIPFPAPGNITGDLHFRFRRINEP